MFHQKYLFLVFRILFGFIFFWAFLDKTFGFGYSTAADKAWMRGVSPTYGFLANTKGVFASWFQTIAGNPLVDILFMAALLGVAVALLLGVFVRLGSYAGAFLMMLMWLAVIPLKTNPFVDDHIVYGLLLIAYAGAQQIPYSFSTRWRQCALVKKYPWFT